MNVARRKFSSLPEAMVFVQQKLDAGYSNVRVITAKSERAKKYNLQNGEVQVRYWR